MLHWYDVNAWNARFGNDSQTVHSLRKFRTRWLKQGWSFEEALAEVAPEVASILKEEIDPHPLALAERHDSQLDGATKLLFRTDEGLMIESVILRAGTGRTSLCISSQIGCAAACRFCATGQMGIARNLTTAQILDQVVQANELLKKEDRRVRNIVFMGMGEPLHNPANLTEAITVLSSPLLLDYSPQRLLVSTVGIPAEMLRLDQQFPQVNLALSLHSADEAGRQQLIPLAKSVPLARLRETLLKLKLTEKRRIMIEYLMLEGQTDRDSDAEKLIAFLENIPAHINLIPYNSIDGADHLTGSTQAARERFGNLLKEAGFPVTIRYSLGADIAAACGQLIQRENREIAKQLRATQTAAK
ncbi:23S rRNA (adenine(2503)-C(2))-methyltransferase RlmN [Blastopirellula marina]|uniref:Radical SAM protein n=1 Tax=Blastopirellula marina TaxID=124 RepID=A0A2S8FHJ2_9BACT|nr:23S rRNA (adenine(2503)-C(2))-methyltransferase RlmN [Blastopirellula marina]PQO31626.1 radical SAM protein [Blastopirellula marina]PTL42933.1 23S rRNA (adenine(2503)-C(2))-methyltransferase RlmN [Blastopirellula marina]